MSPERPLVSVIIPNFNRGKYLREAIESALSQTYEHIEIIVVDDGSTDDSLTVASSFGNKIRLLARKNGGVSVARNAGLSIAKGEIIALLDSDDRMLPTCIEARVAMLLSDENLAMCVGSFHITDEAGNRTGLTDPPKEPPETNHLRAMMRMNWGATCGALYRVRALELCGFFDPLLRVCEDWDLHIRLASRFRFCCDPEPRAEYRTVSGSLSRNVIPMYDGAVKMMRKNRILAGNLFEYIVDSNIGLYNHCMAVVFSRVRDNQLGENPWGSLRRLMLGRPLVAVYFSVWMMRALRNRLLRILGLSSLVTSKEDLPRPS